MNRYLSVEAPEFIPKGISVPPSEIKPKKTKEQRSCPRKRRKNKNKELNSISSIPSYPYTKESDDAKDSFSVISDDMNSISTSSTSISTYISNWMERSEHLSLEYQNTSYSISSIREYDGDMDILRRNSSSSPDSQQSLYPSYHTTIHMDEEYLKFDSFLRENSHNSENNNSNDIIMNGSNIDMILSNNEDIINDARVEVEWLQMQYKWTTTKRNMVYDNEIENEIIERRKWSNWAIHAAEVERQRRIRILREIDDESDRERKARAQWAIEAIEHERNERVYHQFLMSLTSTNWFNEAISSTIEDYELVCPYYKLGCVITCHRSTLAKHLEDCRYAIDCNPPSNIKLMENYEVVCPNSVLGCTFIGGRNEVTNHLQSCPYSHGMSKEQEYEERLQLKYHVILECEEERLRRVETSPIRHSKISPIEKSDFIDSTDNISSTSTYGHPAGVIHNLLRSQIIEVLSQLHDKVIELNLSISYARIQQERQLQYILITLQNFITRLWPFATVEVYGSYSAGLQVKHSDIDLVVCFSDEYESLSKTSGTFPLLHILADFLQREAQGFLAIDNVILNARIPVIKAHASCPVVDSNNQIHGSYSIAVDISIDSPAHSGLATAEMVKTLCRALPPLQPIVMILKEYLHAHGLTDTYHGGISSYGITLLCIIPMLKRIKHNISSNSITPMTVSSNNNTQISLPIDEDGSNINSNSSCSNSSSNTIINVKSAPSSPNRGRTGMKSIQSTLKQNQSVQSNGNFKRIDSLRSRSSSSDCKSTIDMIASTSNNLNNSNSSNTIINSVFEPIESDSNTRLRRNTWESSQAILPNLQMHNPIMISDKNRTELNDIGITNHIYSGNKSYHWSNITKQKMYGKQVAMKLLAYHPSSTSSTTTINLDEMLTVHSLHPDSHSTSSSSNTSNNHSFCLPSNDENIPILLPIERPILGEILEDILHEYGEEMQCGVHGFSVRNGGFRFDVAAKISSSTSSSSLGNVNSCPSHPHANDPIVIEDPVNVINNVGAGCYKALAIQRLFLDAHDRFKSVAVRCNSPNTGNGFVGISNINNSILNTISNTNTTTKYNNNSKHDINNSSSTNITPLSSNVMTMEQDSNNVTNVRSKSNENTGSSNLIYLRATLKSSSRNDSRTDSRSSPSVHLQDHIDDSDGSKIMTGKILPNRLSIASNYGGSEVLNLLQEIFEFPNDFIYPDMIE